MVYIERRQVKLHNKYIFIATKSTFSYDLGLKSFNMMYTVTLRSTSWISLTTFASDVCHCSLGELESYFLSLNLLLRQFNGKRVSVNKILHFC